MPKRIVCQFINLHGVTYQIFVPTFVKVSICGHEPSSTCAYWRVTWTSSCVHYCWPAAHSDDSWYTAKLQKQAKKKTIIPNSHHGCHITLLSTAFLPEAAVANTRACDTWQPYLIADTPLATVPTLSPLLDHARASAEHKRASCSLTVSSLPRTDCIVT